MKTFLKFTIGIFLCCQIPMFVMAAEQADDRVKTALESAEIQFTETKSHDFRMEIKTTEDRTNLVFVNSDTQTDGEYEHREVWAVACSFGDVRDANYSANRSEGYDYNQLLGRLMSRNSGHQTGGFQVAKDSESQWKSLVVYSAVVPADAPGELLKAVIDACAFNADMLEAEWTMQDKR